MMYRELSHITNTTYTPAGRVCRKEQGDPNATKWLLYSYNPTNTPHAARRIYDPTTTNLRQVLWDANGNISQIAEYLYDATNEIVNLQDFRNHYWDEDDRLNLVLDNSHFSYYLYSNDGQRVAKLTGSAFTLGTGFATNAMLDNYTLYPSEYLVITQQGYTKYYYAGGTRIASKLGSGGFEKMTRLCTLDLNITANANVLFNSAVARIGEDMPQDYNSDPCPAYTYDIAGFRVQLPTLNFDPNFGITAQQNILQAFRQNYANEETYYFHGNHLGSANWVTTATASPTQFLLHLPYGEEFVKQLSGSYDERFTFTGKEKDIETGYYYFGARFENVDLGFMSVDPMSDKYPSISPYAYCAWNPVKLVDPSGGEINISQLIYIQEYENVFEKLQNSLSKITGLQLYVDKRCPSCYFLNYRKDGEGNEIVSSDKSSSIARSFLIDMINKKETVNVLINMKNDGESECEHKNNSVTLGIEQIEAFINGVNGVLDKETLGYGMTFLHELKHTDLGGGKKDNLTLTDRAGETVRFMNTIRAELNALGGNYGQRMMYNAVKLDDGYLYIPFDQRSKSDIDSSRYPIEGNFIKFKK